MAKNVIIINHNHYDADSGRLLTVAASAPATPAAAAPLKRQPSAPRRHPVARHAAAHAPKPAQTLMRRAVKKPTPARRLVAQGHVDHLARQPLHRVAVKSSVKKIDNRRLQQAKKVSKSQLVSHFSRLTATSSGQAVESPAPVVTPFDRSAAARASVALSRQTSTTAKPRTTAELLEYALQQATAHEQLPFDLPKRHFFKRRLARSAS